MTTETTNRTPPTRKDYHAAVAAEALALRCLARYGDARSSVKFHGGDLSHLTEPPAYRDIEARYAEQMLVVTREPPDTTSSELAYLELVESIVADTLSPHDGPVMSRDEDLCCALQILHWLCREANDRDIGAAIAEERAQRAAGGAA